MAKIRIGFGSEFNLNDGNLGLGVTNPQVRLDVDGTVKSNDLEVRSSNENQHQLME